MGFGTHPDTLAIARARHEANDTGSAEHSLDWLKAYRNAYFSRRRNPEDRGLSEYMVRLDAQIEQLEQAEAR